MFTWCESKSEYHRGTQRTPEVRLNEVVPNLGTGVDARRSIVVKAARNVRARTPSRQPAGRRRYERAGNSVAPWLNFELCAVPTGLGLVVAPYPGLTSGASHWRRCATGGGESPYTRDSLARKPAGRRRYERARTLVAPSFKSRMCRPYGTRTRCCSLPRTYVRG